MRGRIRRLYERVLRRLLPKRARLRRDIRRLHHYYDPLIDAAKTHDERQSLIGEVWAQIEEPEAELERLDTWKWRKLAHKYFVPLPPDAPREEDNEWWEFNRVLNSHVLTLHGRSFIRKGIREELGWRREQWTGWVSAFAPIVSALVGGFLGAKLGR